MRRRDESGFALLLVFLMAAVIAISLYMEIPRVAFETQRQKEQLLIERGEQYKRAIYMYWKANNQQYPAKMEDLENSMHRFLRHRYIDPMTGKEQWRLIHINNGMLTDSSTMKAKQGDQKQDTTAGQYVGEQAGLGQMPVNPSNQGVNLALRKRPSDSAPNPGSSDTSNSGVPGQPGEPGATAGTPPYPGQAPGMPGSQSYPPGMPGMPGMTGLPGGLPSPGQPGQGATGNTGSGSYVGGSGSYVGGALTGSQPTAPGQPGGYPGQPGNPQYPGMPGMPGSPQTGAPGMPPGAPNPATQMIQNLLTQPRPVGAPMASGMQGGQVIGGGIAGIASKLDADSIMIYNDQTNYSDWEFIFDPAKVKVPPNPLSNTVPMATPGQTNMPGAGSQQGSFGNSSFGNNQSNQFGSQPGMAPGQTGSQPMGSPFGQTPGR